MYTADRRGRTTYQHQEYINYTPNGCTYNEQFESKQGMYHYQYAPNKVLDNNYEGKGYDSYPHHHGKHGASFHPVEHIPFSEERQNACSRVFLPMKILQAWVKPARVKPSEAVVVVQEPQVEKVEENGYNVDEEAGEFRRSMKPLRGKGSYPCKPGFETSSTKRTCSIKDA